MGLFGHTLYLRFDERLARLSDLERGEEASVAPFVAIRSKGKKREVAAIGDSARDLPDCRIVNPLAHDRLVMVEFEVFEVLLRHLMATLKSQWTIVKPRIVLHPLRRLSSDLSDVERRALVSSAFAAGARAVVVHVGPELTRGDLDALSFEHPGADRPE